MAGERWDKLWDVFHAALERPPTEQRAFLDEACRGDASLQGQLESLLKSHQGATGFLEHPTPAESAPTDHSIASHPPERIGRYRIRRVIGSGGTGIVFEAEQDVPRRSVAVKVLRGGAWLDEHRSRLFHREVQSLARLKHPSIAAIYDAGCTDDGLQYFAMEYVEGTALHEFVRALPDLRMRLNLFCDVCDAVSHAHQKGVIHRDLKPANILVAPSLRGSAAQVKILDFGLAHLTDSDVAVTTVVSGGGSISGTLPYMSPEQTRGAPDEIDARTDVYSLGVMLYELLTDRRPYDVTSVPMPEAVRRICLEPPTRPSSHVARLPRDLEAITLKAIEKEPPRRYSTVDALSDDVRRYLAQQPIQARAPTAVYQLRKLVERHKLPALLLAVIVLLLTGLGVNIVVQAARISKERDRALQAARIATEVNAFLNEDLLRSADPRVARGRELTVKDTLDNAAHRLDGRFVDEPLVESAIRATIGETYRRLGRFNLAEPQLLRSAELREKLLGPDHADTLDALRELGVNDDDWRHFDQAQAIFARVLASRRRIWGDRDTGTLRAIDDLAVSFARSGRLTQAEPLQCAALAARRQLLGPEHRDTILSMNNLAFLYQRLGRYSEAEPLAAQAWAAARRILGEDEPAVTLHSANTLAVIYEKQRRFEESEILHLKTLAARRRLLGNTNADTLSSLANLGRLYLAQRRFQDAEPLWVERAQALADDPNADPEQKRAALDDVTELYRAWGRPMPESLAQRKNLSR